MLWPCWMTCTIIWHHDLFSSMERVAFDSQRTVAANCLLLRVKIFIINVRIVYITVCETKNCPTSNDIVYKVLLCEIHLKSILSIELFLWVL